MTAGFFFQSSIGLDLAPAAESSRGSLTVSSIAAHLQSLSRDLGSLERCVPLRAKEASRERPFVIHLQDAHANPSAQKSIAAILSYLAEKYPDLSVAVEGAQGKLHPEWLDLFPSFPKAHQAILEDLASKGELSGAELAAWEHYRRRQSGEPIRSAFYGIESPGEYRDNLATLQKFLESRSEIDRVLLEIQNRIRTESSRVLKPALQEFLKERERRRQGRFLAGSLQENPDLTAYVPYLARTVKKELAIDLEEPLEQFRFPNLVRVLKLLRLEKEFREEEAVRQGAELLLELRNSPRASTARALAQALDVFARRIGLFRAGSPGRSLTEEETAYARALTDKLARHFEAKHLDPEPYAQVWNAFQIRIFASEIRTPEFSGEMNRLEKEMIRRLAPTSAEKLWARRAAGFGLLEKLLHLELTHGELEEVLSGETFYRDLISGLSSAAGPAEERFAEALRFYETALRRDELMFDNALKGNQSPVLVIVTGGFHSEGITNLLESRAMPFAVIRPSMSSTDFGWLYAQVILGAHADLRTYFREKNPFASKRQALLFRNLLENALPVLRDTYGLTPEKMTLELGRAIRQSSILSSGFVVNEVRQGRRAQIQMSPQPIRPSAPEVFTVASPAFLSEVDLEDDGRSNRAEFRIEISDQGVPEMRLAPPSSVSIKRAETRMTFGNLTPADLGRSRAELRKSPTSGRPAREEMTQAVAGLIERLNQPVRGLPEEDKRSLKAKIVEAQQSLTQNSPNEDFQALSRVMEAYQMARPSGVQIILKSIRSAAKILSRNVPPELLTFMQETSGATEAFRSRKEAWQSLQQELYPGVALSDVIDAIIEKYQGRPDTDFSGIQMALMDGVPGRLETFLKRDRLLAAHGWQSSDKFSKDRLTRFFNEFLLQLEPLTLTENFQTGMSLGAQQAQVEANIWDEIDKLGFRKLPMVRAQIVHRFFRMTLEAKKARPVGVRTAGEGIPKPRAEVREALLDSTVPTQVFLGQLGKPGRGQARGEGLSGTALLGAMHPLGLSPEERLRAAAILLGDREPSGAAARLRDRVREALGGAAGDLRLSGQPVALVVPDLDPVPDLRRYQAAFLLVLLNPKSEVTILSVLPRAEIRIYQDELDDQAKKLGLPPGQVRIEGLASRESVFKRAASFGVVSRLRGLLSGLVLLGQVVSFEGEFGSARWVPGMKGDGLDPGTALVTAAAVLQEQPKDLSSPAGFFSLFGWLRSKTDPVEFSSQIEKALEILQAVTSSA